MKLFKKSKKRNDLNLFHARVSFMLRIKIWAVNY